MKIIATLNDGEIGLVGGGGGPNIAFPLGLFVCGVTMLSLGCCCLKIGRSKPDNLERRTILLSTDEVVSRSRTNIYKHCGGMWGSLGLVLTVWGGISLGVALLL